MDSQEMLNLSSPRNITDPSSLEIIPCSTQLQNIMAPSNTNVLINKDTNVPDVDDAYFEVMRRYGVPEPYEKLKELTRGRTVTKESIREFIEGLDIPDSAKTSLLNLTPHTYVGDAVELAKNVETAINLANHAKIL